MPRLFYIFLLFFLPLSACDRCLSMDDIGEAKSRWAISQPINYQILYIKHCNCEDDGKETSILVKDGKLTKINGKSFQNDLITLRGKFFTVDDLFYILTEANNQDRCSVKSKFDTQFGFPRSIAFGERNSMDSAVSIEVTDFNLLKSECCGALKIDQEKVVLRTEN